MALNGKLRKIFKANATITRQKQFHCVENIVIDKRSIIACLNDSNLVIGTRRLSITHNGALKCKSTFRPTQFSPFPRSGFSFVLLLLLLLWLMNFPLGRVTRYQVACAARHEHFSKIIFLEFFSCVRHPKRKRKPRSHEVYRWLFTHTHTCTPGYMHIVMAININFAALLSPQHREQQKESGRERVGGARGRRAYNTQLFSTTLLLLSHRCSKA